MASEANAEEIKEEKGIKAKTVSLIGKIIGGAIILIGLIGEGVGLIISFIK